MLNIEATKLALHKRRGFWAYVRRVPLAYTPHDSRGLVILSTGIRITDDPKGIRAKPEVVRLNACTEQFWRDRAAGLDVEAFQRYARSIRQNVAFGFEPVGVEELLARDDEEDFAARVNAVLAVSAAKKVPDVKMLEALMDVQETPGIRVSTLLEEYEKIGAATLQPKSAGQIKKWRGVRQSALDRFIEVIGGDRVVGVLKRSDTVQLREHFQKLIHDKKVTISTANKSMKLVGAMYRAVDEHHQLDLKPVFDKLLIRGGKDGKRVAFDPAFIQSHILADGMFDTINEEARGLIYLLVETGLRLSEACNLNEKTIILDHNIPHVVVEPDGRELKTEQSRRVIPLVGVALLAMRQHPKGFPRYRDKADSFSAFANKVFLKRGLRPLPDQSIYSLWHSFKDRMRNARANEELMDMLMGHSIEKRKGKDYGEGYFLPIKLELLSSIALRPPSKV